MLVYVKFNASALIDNLTNLTLFHYACTKSTDDRNFVSCSTHSDGDVYQDEDTVGRLAAESYSIHGATVAQLVAATVAGCIRSVNLTYSKPCTSYTPRRFFDEVERLS